MSGQRDGACLGRGRLSVRPASCLAALLLLVHTGLSFAGLLRDSVTLDEYAHLPAGLSYWQKRTFFLYSVNPPLTKMFATVPLLPLGARMDYGESFRPIPGARLEWHYGRTFMEANQDRYFLLFRVARIPMILVSVLAGFLVFRWSCELYGGAAGVIAVALYSFCPNTLAHSHLVTPDIGATALALLASYVFWKWLLRPTWRMTLTAGLLLGLAELTKFTLLILYPLWGLMALWWFARARSEGCTPRPSPAQRLMVPPAAGGPRFRWLIRLSALFALSLLVINGGYGFEGSFRQLQDFPFCSRLLTRERIELVSGAESAIGRYRLVHGNRFVGTWLARLPIPLPEHYVLGIDFQQRDLEEHPFPSYLRGTMRRDGWWHYYLYGLAVKLPLGTLGLLLGASLAAGFLRVRGALVDELVVLLPAAAILVLVSSQTGMNQHLRYVLPVLPFLFIVASRVGVLFSRSVGTAGTRRCAIAANTHVVQYAAIGVVMCCLAFNGISAAKTHPSYLSYFNELAGGPENGPEHLINSNIDWGQDLFALAQWLHANPHARPMKIAYFGFVDPRLAGVELAEQLPPFDPRFSPYLDDHERRDAGPQPGWYAISVNFVYGMGFPSWTRRGVQSVSDGAYKYFRECTPVARAGHSIYIYHLTPADANRLRRTMGLPPLLQMRAARDGRRAQRVDAGNP